ncbi:MAG: ATP-binding protein [Thermoplasmatota archaeon]
MEARTLDGRSLPDLLGRGAFHLFGSMDIQDTLRAIADVPVSAGASGAMVYYASRDGPPDLFVAGSAGTGTTGAARPESLDAVPREIRELLELGPTPRSTGTSSVSPSSTSNAGADPWAQTPIRRLKDTPSAPSPDHELLAGPLHVRGQTVGAFAIWLQTSHGTESTRTELVARYARLSSNALEHALLLRAERRAREEAERAHDRVMRLYEVTNRLAGAFTESDAGEIILHSSLDALNANGGSVALLRPGSTFEIVASFGSGDLSPHGARVFARKPGTPAGDCLDSGTPLFFHSPDELLGSYSDLRHPTESGHRAWAVLPMVADGKSMGVVTLSFIETVPFTQEDQSFLIALARQCADVFARVRVNHERTQAANLLDMIFSAAPVGLAVVDRDLRYVRYNDTLGLIGLANVSPVAPGGRGKLGDDFPRLAAEFEPHLRRVLDTGEPVAAVEVSSRPGLPLAQGGWLISCFPLRHEDGAIHGAGLLAVEITRVKAAEDALRKSEAWLRAVYSSLEDAIFVINEDARRIVRANPAAERMFGFRSGEIVGQSLEIFHVDRAHYEEFMARAGESFVRAQPLRIELKMRRRNGYVFDAHATVTHLVEDAPNGKRSIGRLLVIRDISSRKRSESERERLLAELRSERALLTAVVQQMPAGVALAEAPSGRLILSNDRLNELLGHDGSLATAGWATLPDAHLRFTNGEPMRPEEWPLARSVQSGETIVGEELDLARDDGTASRLIIHSRPVLDQNGSVVAGVAILEDVTDQRRQQRELDEARRLVSESEKLAALGMLVSGVAHEIRTPLTYISNHLLILRRRLERMETPPSDALEHIDAAAEGIARINHLVGDLRRFTHARPAGEFIEIAGSAVVSEAIDLFRATHGGSSQIEAHLGDGGVIRVNKIQVQQAILNLLQNGVEAMGHGGKVVVQTREARDAFIVTVTDEGPGIPPEIVSRMYEPFFTTKPGGTGLGLSIVRKICEAHGGSIRCHSIPGRGTTFVLSFPRVATTDHHLSAPETPEEAAAPQHHAEKARQATVSMSPDPAP